MLCVAVGSCHCKNAVLLCNMRDFHFCLIKRQYATPFNKSISFVAIVMGRDINSIRDMEYWQCLYATPINADGGFMDGLRAVHCRQCLIFYRWMCTISECSCMQERWVKITVHCCQSPGVAFHAMHPHSFVLGFTVTRLANILYVTCPNSVL